MASRSPDPRQLSDLLEVSQTLGATLNLRQALQRVLSILEESRGTLSSLIVLRDETASRTIGDAWRTSSTATDDTFSPPVTMTSFSRSTTHSRPASSHRPRSPVRSSPSTKVAAVAPPSSQ